MSARPVSVDAAVRRPPLLSAALPAWLAAAFLLLVALAAAFGPMLGLQDPYQIDAANLLSSPTWKHWLGTDELGRDLLSRAVHGARVSLTVAAAAVRRRAGRGHRRGRGLPGSPRRGRRHPRGGRVRVPARDFRRVGGAGLYRRQSADAGRHRHPVRAAVRARGLGVARGIRARSMCRRRARSGRAGLDHLARGAAQHAFHHRGAGLVHVFLRHAAGGRAELPGAGRASTGAILGPDGGLVEGLSLHQSWPVLVPALALFFTVLAVNVLGDWLQDALNPELRR